MGFPIKHYSTKQKLDDFRVLYFWTFVPFPTCQSMAHGHCPAGTSWSWHAPAEVPPYLCGLRIAARRVEVLDSTWTWPTTTDVFLMKVIEVNSTPLMTAIEVYGILWLYKLHICIYIHTHEFMVISCYIQNMISMMMPHRIDGDISWNRDYGSDINQPVSVIRGGWFCLCFCGAGFSTLWCRLGRTHLGIRNILGPKIFPGNYRL